MRGFLKMGFLLGMLVLLCLLVQIDVSHSKRPLFEYKGNYRENLNKQIEDFKRTYGYALMDLDVGWRPRQVSLMEKAFSKLPAGFLRLHGLKGFYRTGYLQSSPKIIPTDEVPAATFPTFLMVYRGMMGSHRVEIKDEELRIEFYNPLFNEDSENIINIIQHEMAHAYDIAKGMISFSPEWLEISQFRLLNMPPLDARKGGDFLFTFLNDPLIENYAPVSTRHHPNYSRKNPQEDFANSVAAYIHYPYFQYTNPRRYRFLKERVFGGREYFPHMEKIKTYEQAVLVDLDQEINAKEWTKAGKTLVELSRISDSQLDGKIIPRLRQAIEADNTAAYELGLGSCFLYHPDSVEFRKNLVRGKRVKLRTFLKNERCSQVGRDWFEKALVKLPAEDVYYYRKDGRNIIQFFDPAALVAFTRGFKTEYRWKLGFEDKVSFADGHLQAREGGYGSVKIDLGESSGKEVHIPFGEKLVLDLDIRRSHPKNFKIFNSNSTRIRFVVQPWFDYEGSGLSEVKVIYPLGLLFLEKAE